MKLNNAHGHPSIDHKIFAGDKLGAVNDSNISSGIPKVPESEDMPIKGSRHSNGVSFLYANYYDEITNIQVIDRQSFFSKNSWWKYLKR